MVGRRALGFIVSEHQGAGDAESLLVQHPSRYEAIAAVIAFPAHDRDLLAVTTSAFPEDSAGHGATGPLHQYRRRGPGPDRVLISPAHLVGRHQRTHYSTVTLFARFRG